MSEISSTTLRRACKIVHVDAVQVEYSPFDLDIERSKGTDLLATCRELGVAVVAYSPLGKGILTDAFVSKKSLPGEEGDMRSAFPRFSGDNVVANAKLAAQFKSLAENKGCTAAQLAIAWLLRQGPDIIPIPGTRRIKYLEENWGALKVELTDADEAEVRKFVEAAEVAGGRTPDMVKHMCYIDTKEE